MTALLTIDETMAALRKAEQSQVLTAWCVVGPLPGIVRSGSATRFGIKVIGRHVIHHRAMHRTTTNKRH
jgi:hypothetical protein